MTEAYDKELTETMVNVLTQQKTRFGKVSTVV